MLSHFREYHKLPVLRNDVLQKEENFVRNSGYYITRTVVINIRSSSKVTVRYTWTCSMDRGWHKMYIEFSQRHPLSKRPLRIPRNQDGKTDLRENG
jgi:hypothetical protein